MGSNLSEMGFILRQGLQASCQTTYCPFSYWIVGRSRRSGKKRWGGRGHSVSHLHCLGPQVPQPFSSFSEGCLGFYHRPPWTQSPDALAASSRGLVPYLPGLSLQACRRARTSSYVRKAMYPGWLTARSCQFLRSVGHGWSRVMLGSGRGRGSSHLPSASQDPRAQPPCSHSQRASEISLFSQKTPDAYSPGPRSPGPQFPTHRPSLGPQPSPALDLGIQALSPSSLRTRSPGPHLFLPLQSESGPPTSAFPDLEEPGEDIKLKDGHMATACEIDGGAQGLGCGA